MVLHNYVTALVLSACTAGCQSDDDEWSCSGSQGKTPTCDSPGARAVLAAKYDARNGCFEAVLQPPGLCAGPTYCGRGGGTAVCAVTPSGDAYFTYLLYGEETTKPGWHYDNEFLGTSVRLLTSSEEPLCKSLWSAFGGLVDADAGALDEMALYDERTFAVVTPACE